MQEWKKEDQLNLNNFTYNQSDNSIELEVIHENKSKTKTLRVKFNYYHKKGI